MDGPSTRKIPGPTPGHESSLPKGNHHFDRGYWRAQVLGALRAFIFKRRHEAVVGLTPRVFSSNGFMWLFIH